MKNFICTLSSAAGGVTATASALALSDTIMFWVGLGITVVTTIFNAFLDLRRKWKKEKESENKKGDE